MKKLLISLIAVSMVLCVGCSEKKTDTSVNSTENTVSVTENKETGFFSLIKDLTICGKAVSLPCTLKELDSGFSIYDPIDDEYNNWVFTTLKYDNTDIGTIYLERRSDGKYEDSQILSLILNSHSGAVIKGISMESSEADIIKALGEDYTKNDYNLDYGNENDGLVRILMNGMTNTPISFTILMPKQ